MKVGYVAPMSISAVNGGIRTQAQFTIQHCKRLSVEPVLLSPWDDIKSLDLDLVHVFGASIENTGIINQLKALEIPIALSPVVFSTRKSSTIRRVITFNKLFDKVGNGLRFDFRIKADLCDAANLILPNTRNEALLIEQGFSIPTNKIHIVPNGVETRFASATPDLFVSKYGVENVILFVGQAGAPRKNVKALLEIAPKIKAPVVIIGEFHNDEYGTTCKKLAKQAGNVTLIGPVPHDSELLPSAYAAADVFVLPSQYETPGIAALEAALAGCNIAITEHGGTKDYFDGFAEFLDPGKPKTILNAINKAMVKPYPQNFKAHILANFTWDKVAEQTVSQYKKLLS